MINITSLIFGRIFLWSHLVLDSCLQGFIIIITIESMSFLVFNLFKLSVSSWFNFGGLYVSRNLSISSRFPIGWHIIVHSILLCFFTFLCYQLRFLILFIWVHSLFFLVSLARVLSILFTLSKNQILVLLTFSIIFLISILCISFLLLTLDFVYSFSNSFKWYVGLFIWDFSGFF